MEVCGGKGQILVEESEGGSKLKRLFVLLAIVIFLASVEICGAKMLLEIAESVQQPMRDRVITMTADSEEYTIFDVLDEYSDDLPTEVWLDPAWLLQFEEVYKWREYE